MSLRSPLARARGLGSAKDGTNHWWMQRLTAVALIPLSLWFVYSLLYIVVNAGHADVVEWFANPVTSLLMVFLLVAMFYHAKLGMQVIIEDYIHHEGLKVTLLVLNTLAMFVMGVVSIFAVTKMHFLDILAMGV